MSYVGFIKSKGKQAEGSGIHGVTPPDWLYDFQKTLTTWALSQGRSAIFADCGLGKTAMQLAWAAEIVRRYNKPSLILTPLAVGAQTVREAEKFGVSACRIRQGGEPPSGYDVVVSNYEQMHKMNPGDYCAVVCDESGCIKDFKSKRRDVVTSFLKTIPFRLLCTATPSPNDFHELGTSSEALGMLGFRDMVTKFFKQETQLDQHGWGRTKYRFRGHAEQPFWKWVCSWARAVRMPSDVGGSDEGYLLPKLDEREIIVDCKKTRPGMLFALPGKTLNEQRAERRNSINERCDKAAEILSGVDTPAVSWCELNSEGDLLESMIDGARQVKGAMTDEEKEELLLAFTDGQIDRLVIKPKIGAWGLNWQHCSDMTIFPSHSYEQYYQAVRRCYRFGQDRNVVVSNIVNEGEAGVLQSIRRKSDQAAEMFKSVVRHMNDSMHLVNSDCFNSKEEIPSWL